MRIIRIALAAMFFSFLTNVAFADDERDDRYMYVFTDDPLHAEDLLSGFAVIKVRPGPARVLLIRPRTDFLNELISSTWQL
jgi:hypothetical protein